MIKGRRYWLHDKNAPYATFLAVAEAFLSPESDDTVEEMRDYVNDSSVSEGPIFKADFREIIKNPSVLPEGALGTATAYDNAGSDEEFLAWLWPQLYGDEPVDL